MQAMPDTALDDVLVCWQAADANGERAARVLRATFDQLYDGQHTGRFRGTSYLRVG